MANISPLEGIEHEELLQVQLAEMRDEERMFVLAYMRSHNISLAYRECGAEKKPGAAAAMFKREAVRSMIASLTNARMRRLQVTPARIEEELAKVAFSTAGAFMRVQEDGTAYLDFAASDDVHLAGLQSFKCKVVHRPGDDPDNPKDVLEMEVKLWPKVDALGKLAQIHKMISGDVQVAVTVDVAEEIRARRRERAGLPPVGE